MTTAERRLLQQTLAAQGVTITGKDWPRKATYYKPDGEAMPNLPADPGSMQRYLGRGYTLAPPKPKPVEQPVAVAAPVAVVPMEAIVPSLAQTPLLCACGFLAKSDFGLLVHQRKHGKEKS